MAITFAPSANVLASSLAVNNLQYMISITGQNCAGSTAITFDNDYELIQIAGWMTITKTETVQTALRFQSGSYYYWLDIRKNFLDDPIGYYPIYEKFHKIYVKTNDTWYFTNTAGVNSNFGCFLLMQLMSSEEKETIRKCDVIDWLLGRCSV